MKGRIGMDVAERAERIAGLLGLFRDRATPHDDLNGGIQTALDGYHGVRDGVDFVGTFDGAMGLVPLGSWFVWNHFGFHYVPNVAVSNAPVHNALDYYPKGPFRDGGPVGYESRWGDSDESRRSLPRMVCEAVVMASRTPLLKELARANGRPYLVQTASGPFLVTPEGRFEEIGSGLYLTRDGERVAYDEKVHGHARIEDPYA